MLLLIGFILQELAQAAPAQTPAATVSYSIPAIYFIFSLGIVLVFLVTLIFTDFVKAALATLGMIVVLAISFSVYEWLHKSTTGVKTKEIFDFSIYENP